MRRSAKPGIVPILIVMLLALSAALQADVEGKGGSFDCSFDQAQKVGTRLVQWFWWPYSEIGSVGYVVYAYCERFDEEGQPAGKNRIVVLEVELRGVDTDTVIEFRKQKAKLRDGQQKEILTWDASEVVSIAHETVVVGAGKVKVRGKIAAGDSLHCEIGLAEVTEGAVAAGGP